MTIKMILYALALGAEPDHLANISIRLYSTDMIQTPNIRWDGSLESLFAVLDEACRRGTPPCRLDMAEPPGRAAFFPGPPPGGENGFRQPELFAAPESPRIQAANGQEQRGGPAVPALAYSLPLFPELRYSPAAVLLHELSADAFGALVHAWMSELPIGAEMLRFAWNVIFAARGAAKRGEVPGGETPLRRPGEPAKAAGAGAAAGTAVPAKASAVESPGWAALPEARLGADRAAANRGDPDVRTVLEAAYKVRRETDRLMGLLRFSPCPRNGAPGGETPGGGFPGAGVPPGGGSAGGSGGFVYIARCSPDHHILPGLAEHFSRRFGEYPWAVIDEKRNLVLAGEPGEEARLFPLPGYGPAGSFSPGGSPDSGRPPAADSPAGSDYIEDLWRNYHRSINNPDRNNPALQRQFIPRRYRKYLPEFR
jgi:probable DNA metabolism protein